MLAFLRLDCRMMGPEPYLCASVFGSHVNKWDVYDERERAVGMVEVGV
jgi:hypothetical protein